LSRPWQDELRNLKTRPPSDIKTAVPRDRVGKADPLCPVVSHVDLLGDCQGVIDLDAEVPHGTFDFGMA
jgi:hypothetical protein